MRLMLIIPLAVLFLLTACNENRRKSSGRPIAKVHNNYLYDTDLADVVPSGTPAKDSIEMVRNYIQNWIRQGLVVHQAEKNLTREQKDFTKELEDYRNSLIVYNYESKLIRQKLDTNITEKQIEDYYNQNPSNFELKDNIVRVLYVKLLLKDPNTNIIRNLIRSNKPSDRDRLTQLCSGTAVNFYLDDNSWLFFNDLLKEIPVKTYNQEDYLKNHRFVEFSDGQFTYLLNIVDFRIKEGLSPQSLEKENIRSILINKRKMKLIADLEQDVYKQAIKDKSFIIF